MADPVLNVQQLIETLYHLPYSTGIYTGPELRIVAMNHTLLRFWGKEASIIGQTIEEAIPELKNEIFIGLLKKVWATGDTYEAVEQKTELRIAGVKQSFYYDYAFRAIKDNEGRMVCILHTAADVTERVLSRTRTLQTYFSVRNTEVPEGEAALLLAIESAGLALWSLNLETRSLYVSDRQREMFGLPAKADISLEAILRIVEPADLELMRKRIAEAVKLNRKIEFEYRIKHPVTQQPAWIRGFCKSILDEDGKPVSIFGVNMDITEQLRAADLLKEYNQNLQSANSELRGVINRLRQSEDRLSLAISSANLGTWHLDVVTREFIASPRLKELFGYHPQDTMTSEDATARVVEEHRERVIALTELAISEGTAYEVEYPIIGYHDGRVRWVRATGKLFMDADQKTNYFSGTVADITERHQEEQRKNDFMSMVSHELKTPLTSVKGYLQLMRLNAPADDPIAIESFDRSLKQIDKMTAMINGFLDVSQLEFGQVRIDKQVFDMADLLHESKAETQAGIGSHEVVYGPVAFMPVHADPAKIAQVIHNLVNNAVKYSPAGSTINVDCAMIDGQAVVTVKDQGIGIDANDLDKVFNRFYRVAGAQGKAVSGFGIGLYIAKYIIERHEGRIMVVSEPGVGSIFSFTLPVVA